MDSDKPDRAPLFSLDRTTLVPIGLLISVVLASIGATTWIQRTVLGVEHKIDLLDARMSALHAITIDRWALADQIAWAELLQARNPELKVPLPKTKQ